MKVVVIGSTGQLGSDIVRRLTDRSVSSLRSPITTIALTHADIEITDLVSVKRVLRDVSPTIIINTAAFHRVDDCETDPQKAFLVNAIGASNIAIVAEEVGAKLVYISTDYVFGADAPADEAGFTEFDTPQPVNVYGKSKLAGEMYTRHLCSRHFIVRVSGLFGVAGSSGKGGNFVETILKLARERDRLNVVCDQVFSPTYTWDLARKIIEIMITDQYGLYHVTNSGHCSWYEFAREILRQVGSKTPVIPIPSDAYPQKAVRPRVSVLNNYVLKLLGLYDMRPWQDALADYMRMKGHGTTR